MAPQGSKSGAEDRIQENTGTDSPHGENGHKHPPNDKAPGSVNPHLPAGSHKHPHGYHPPKDSDNDKHSSVPPFWVFIIIVVVLVIIAFVAFTIWRRMQAKKRGLPPPPLNPFAKNRNSPTAGGAAAGGAVGWVSGKIKAMTGGGRGRYATPGYENARGERGAGMGADEAWDARVGHEETAYHNSTARGGFQDEHELGPAGGQGGTSYNDLGTGYAGRSRDFDGYDDAHHDGPGQDPFSDHAESSNIGKKDWDAASKKSAAHRSVQSVETSSARGSVFREDI